MAMYWSSTMIIYHYLLSSTTIYDYGPTILWLHSPGQPNLEQMTLTFYFADGGSRSIDRLISMTLQWQHNGKKGNEAAKNMGM